jgi:hypothetical protein
MSSPTKPGSINARGGYEEVPRAVNNLINNQPGKRPSASSTRETSPLVTVSGGDSNGLEVGRAKESVHMPCVRILDTDESGVLGRSGRALHLDRGAHVMVP